MFKQRLCVRMYDTDAAGILYFGSQFRFAHDTFEGLMVKEGFTFHQLFTKEDFIFVIAHAESDYLAPMHVGDVIDVTAVVSHIGTTSFEISYTIHKEDGQLTGKSKTVHVCLDKKARTKRPLPDSIREKLGRYVGAA
jgi:1,4-dihydroxy-2-naphthoyl-CoA hydrolase